MLYRPACPEQAQHAIGGCRLRLIHAISRPPPWYYSKYHLQRTYLRASSYVCWQSWKHRIGKDKRSPRSNWRAPRRCHRKGRLWWSTTTRRQRCLFTTSREVKATLRSIIHSLFSSQHLNRSPTPNPPRCITKLFWPLLRSPHLRLRRLLPRTTTTLRRRKRALLVERLPQLALSPSLLVCRRADRTSVVDRC